MLSVLQLRKLLCIGNELNYKLHCARCIGEFSRETSFEK